MYEMVFFLQETDFSQHWQWKATTNTKNSAVTLCKVWINHVGS